MLQLRKLTKMKVAANPGEDWFVTGALPIGNASCQRAEMLTHHTLEMLRRRTG